MELTKLTGEEFARKILGGERDFANIRLERNFHLSEHPSFSDIQKYLQEEDLSDCPIILRNSELIGIMANGLSLPFLDGESANLERAFIPYANLMSGNFARANLSNAYFNGTNFSRDSAMQRATNFQGALLFQTDFRHANLINSLFYDVDATGGNFQGALLCMAIFYNTNLEDANLERSDLTGSYFKKTDFIRTFLKGACFDHAYLEDTRNLGNSYDLDAAVLEKRM